jgi:hypothetical protein
MMTLIEQAKHGYVVTEYHTTNGIMFGILWLDTGIETVAWETVEQAERNAERLLANARICVNAKGAK